MRQFTTLLTLALLLAACEPTQPPPHTELPTLMVLPTESLTPPASATPDGTLVGNATQLSELGLTQTAQNATVTAAVALDATFADLIFLTQTAETRITLDAAATASAPPPATSTATPTPDLSATATFTASITVTPSLTITDTPTRTPTSTPLPTLNMDRPLIQLAILALSATPQPTGMAVAFTPTGFIPPGNTGGTLCLPPPGGFGTVYAADTALAAQLGCPLGVTLTYPIAVQTFERGTMIYVGTTPSSIYVLSSAGTYSRYPDTFVDGVDPASGGEIAPSNLFEPVRGFGKVWRTNPGVRDMLGWATQPEAGAAGTLLLFQSGQMIALPPIGQVAVLTSIGTFRLLPGTS